MGETNAAVIIPFAQAEIVYRFIRGIDPGYKRELNSLLRNLLTTEYPERIVREFAGRTTEEERRNVQAELIRIGRAIVDNFDSHWADWEHNKFVEPVLDIVGDLPKDDLAAMAEPLVNLTSFKRRITAEAETVGGPIDVAVISKRDGFVWIIKEALLSESSKPSFLRKLLPEGRRWPMRSDPKRKFSTAATTSSVESFTGLVRSPGPKRKEKLTRQRLSGGDSRENLRARNRRTGSRGTGGMLP
jgi:hypothetical protein